MKHLKTRDSIGGKKKKKLYYRRSGGTQKWKRPDYGDDGRGARGKIARVHYGWSPVGDKRRPGNLAIVGYRHPEVALIEIMIGGLMWRAEDEGGTTERDG